MIKRLWFLPVAHGGDTPWIQMALDTSSSVTPVRLVTCAALGDDLGDSPARDSPHGRIDIAWFTDLGHLRRFDEATRTVGGDARSSDCCTIAANELVLRGGDWLATRWRNGGSRLKHVALAKRAAGLSAEEFSQRWQSHAGTAGSTPIPDSARGLAYVQNHPLQPQPGRASGNTELDCPYDAVNEVWFDEPAQLRERISWMAENLPPEGADPLFGERHSLAVEERLVLGGP